MTAARIPPAMTTVPADIRSPLHQQPAGRAPTKTVTEAKPHLPFPRAEKNVDVRCLFTSLGRERRKITSD